MSTTYDDTPSILERVIGSDLILLATVRGPVRVSQIAGAENARVHGWFEVAIRDTLSGHPPSDTVTVRVIGEGTENEVTWPVPVPTDEPALCFLTRDVGPDLPTDLCAACHNGVYTVAADGVAEVPDTAMDEATRKLAGSGRGGLPLEGLRRLIETVARRRDAELRAVEENEPADIRSVPRPELAEYLLSADDVVEASLARPGGGDPADLD
jgi:hypothetical protein